MSLRLQIVVVVGMAVAIALIIHLLGKKKMDFKFGLGWILVALCVLFFAISPNLLARISAVIGIVSPVNMLFFFGFILSVVIIFSMSMTISVLSDKVRKLSQELAIIRKDMHDNYFEKEE